MILASAIKFTIISTGQQVVLCGARHGDVFRQLAPLGFEPRDGYIEEEQGFIDHHNNFLTRPEALEHAYQCGQLSNTIYHNRKGSNETVGLDLLSEDLW